MPLKDLRGSLGTVVRAFNPSPQGKGKFLSLSPACSTKWVPGQPGVQREKGKRARGKKGRIGLWLVVALTGRLLAAIVESQ